MIRRKLFAYTISFAAGIAAGFLIFEKAAIIGGTLVMLACAVSVFLFPETSLHRDKESHYARSPLSDARGPLSGSLSGAPTSLHDSGVHTSLYDSGTHISHHVGCAYTSHHDSGTHTSLHVSSAGMRILAALCAGFLLFACRYVLYGTSLINQNSDQPESSYGNTSEAESSPSNENTSEKESSSSNVKSSKSEIEQCFVTGFARSVTVKNGKIRIVLTDTDKTRHGIRIMVYVRDEDYYDPAEIIGRRITAYGTLREPSGADNPGCFDYRIYLRSKGIGYILSARAVDIADQNESYCKSNVKSDFRTIRERLQGKYIRTLYSARESFLDRFEDEEVRGFIKGAVFGDKSDISDDVMEDFTGNGTGHILAVSGLHTGYLYSLLRLLTGKRRTVSAAAATIALLIMYGDMTMWSPSTVRAVTVLSISILSLYARRPFDLLTAVSAAAMLILVREPYQLFSTGFQMSFLALLGIAFLSGPLSHFTGETLAVMISVQAGIMPLTAYIFHRINVLSIFINLPVIFLASLLVPLCMTALLISAAVGLIPGLVITATEGLTDIIIRFNEIVSADGMFSDLVTGAFPGTVTGLAAGFTMLFYLAAFMLSSEWCRVRLLRHEYRIIMTALLSVTLISMCTGIASYNRFADDEIVFVSVGQGDCTHIRAGGKDVLIDGGGDTERNIGKDVLMPYMLANGAERAEIALVTHLHTDHYRGIAELAKVYPVGSVGIPSDYRKSVEKQRAEEEKHESHGVVDQQGEGPQSNWHSYRKNGNMLSAEKDESQYSDGKDENQHSGKKYESQHLGKKYDSQHSSKKDESQHSDNNYESRSPLALPDNIIFLDPDSVIRVTDDVFIEVIWPIKGESENVDTDDPNEHNMVYMIHYNKFGRDTRVMVTGDLLEEDELKMVDYYAKARMSASFQSIHSDAQSNSRVDNLSNCDTVSKVNGSKSSHSNSPTDSPLKCDVLKVAHHGSKSSSSEAFLDVASPSIAVIEVGLNNWYGHPHQQTLDRLEERGIEVYRTDINGAVGIDILRNYLNIDTVLR